ncbi:Neurogenic locus notch 1 [Merluccius polli]|uniref:Neurogenic locus notch 1 n=1 Tax=Merluccius polli TaxID=89951 RepID=A0AA47P1D8_MERPO|nr:Neurogenic locus notch 1 [Merluccius polli]
MLPLSHPEELNPRYLWYLCYCRKITSHFQSCQSHTQRLLCQLDDACISNPCQKGSNCDTNPVNGNYVCTCPPGYVGNLCDRDVDECALDYQRSFVEDHQKNMPPQSEALELEVELRSIEKLIEELLQQKTALYTRLASVASGESLQSMAAAAAIPAEADPVNGASPGASSWATVVRRKKGKKGNPALPLFDPGISDIMNGTIFAPSAFFPLDTLPLVSSPLQAPRVVFAQGAEAGEVSSSTPSSQRSHRKKRPVSCIHSPDSPPSMSPPGPAPRDKRARTCPQQHVTETLPNASIPAAPSPPLLPPTHQPVPPGPRRLACLLLPTPPAHTAIPLAAQTATISDPLHPKLRCYNSKVNSSPQILIAGDSLVRDLVLPGSITYCLSGGKIADLIQLVPCLLERHPSITMVVSHVGVNDVMDRLSTKMRLEMESLCTTVESLGKRCIISGPIPTLYKRP